MDTRIFTLKNGLKAVCRKTEGLVSYIGVAINAGSRDDGPNHGLAHFVEHTVFKGTPSRNAWKIAARMESVGGELNAYTSKEETLIYTNAPAGYELRALELLSDLIANSLFPKQETEREKQVVIEEINSYLDSPADSVYDEFEELAFKGSNLAHNILGTHESVRGLTPDDCRRFINTRYTQDRMVLYVVSPRTMVWMENAVMRYFSNIQRTADLPIRNLPPAMKPFEERRERGGHQANTIFGCTLFGRNDPRRFPLFLLNNHLGGPGMNSRLNRELRDRHGYVYTVESNVSLLSDTGLFSVYFGSDPSTVDKCIRIIRNEIDRFAQSEMSPSGFENMKTQYCGQLMVGSDHRESRAMSLAKSLLYFGEVHDIEDTAERIRAVTRSQFRECAEMLASKPTGILTLI